MRRVGRYLRHFAEVLGHIHTAIWLWGFGGAGVVAAVLYAAHIHFAGAAAILLVAFVLIIAGGAYRDRVRLSLIDVAPEPARTRDDIVYKSKLRVLLKNDTKQILHFWNVKWIAGRHGVPFQKPEFWFRYELENVSGYKSGKPWQTERTYAYVDPGKVFRVSVSLEQSVSDEEVRQRLKDRRLGTLVLIFQIGGHDDEWEIDI